MGTSSEGVNSQLANIVFDMELVREKILEYVIYKEEQVLRPNVRSCRLVNKTWLQSISRILRKIEKPLFQFVMRDALEITDCYRRIVEQDDMPVDLFMESVALNKFLDGQVPLFSLSTEGCYFVERNYQRFFDLLNRCGSNLVHLKLQLSHHRASLTLEPNILLPKLQSLTVVLDTPEYNGDQFDVIQSVFDSSPHLQSFTLNSYHNLERLPGTLNNLVLPSSITHVDLNGVLNECQLEQVLLKNPLPNIKALKLRIIPTPLKKSTILTSVLEKFRKTLQTVQVKNMFSPRHHQKNVTIFRLPLMEKLKELHISEYFELDEDSTCCLERLVPNLNQLTLNFHLNAMFQKWTERSCFETVNSLTVSLVSDNYYDNTDDEDDDAASFINFDFGTMTSLKAAFPNLVHLDISFYGPPMQPVFGIMMQLRKLKTLKIFVKGGQEDVENLDVFDALFLGIPKSTLPELRNDPQLFQNLLEDRKLVSIRNLTDLETLNLEAEYASKFFISDLSFEFAFLKLPRLTKLLFWQGFYTTASMTEKWRGEGRFIRGKNFCQ